MLGIHKKNGCLTRSLKKLHGDVLEQGFRRIAAVADAEVAERFRERHEKAVQKKRKANAKAAAGSAAVESTADASQTQGAARPESQQQPGH